MVEEKKCFLSAADIDTSNGVTVVLDNPYYQNSIEMELGYEWPKDRIHLIQIIKAAVRMNLKITMYSPNKEANGFINRYYREYACLDYLEEHPDELEVAYPWLVKENK